MNTPLFSQLFSRSPFTQLQDHMRLAVECAQSLPGYFDAVFSEDWTRAKASLDRIVTLEHEADELKAQLRLSLPRSIFLPIPRADIFRLVKLQDKIPNTAKDVAGVIYGRKITLPPVIRDVFLDYIRASNEAPAIANEIIAELDRLVRSGASSPHVEMVEGLLTRLTEAEHESDVQQIAIRAAIYSVEDQLSPVDAVILYQTTTWIGDLADHAESIGDSILYLIAH